MKKETFNNYGRSTQRTDVTNNTEMALPQFETGHWPKARAQEMSRNLLFIKEGWQLEREREIGSSRKWQDQGRCNHGRDNENTAVLKIRIY